MVDKTKIASLNPLQQKTLHQAYGAEKQTVSPQEYNFVFFKDEGCNKPSSGSQGLVQEGEFPLPADAGASKTPTAKPAAAGTPAAPAKVNEGKDAGTPAAAPAPAAENTESAKTATEKGKLVSKTVTETTTTYGSPIDGQQLGTKIMIGGAVASATVMTSAAVAVVTGSAALAAVPVIGVVALGIFGLSRLFGRNRRQKTIVTTKTIYEPQQPKEADKAKTNTPPAPPTNTTGSNAGAGAGAGGTNIESLMSTAKRLRKEANEAQKNAKGKLGLDIQNQSNKAYIAEARYLKESGADTTVFINKYKNFLNRNSAIRNAIDNNPNEYKSALDILNAS